LTYQAVSWSHRIAHTGPNQFVSLTGDCFYHHLYYNPGGGISSEIYHDINLAREAVSRLKAMDNADNVVVLLARENDEMPLFPYKLHKWAEEEIERKKAGAQKRLYFVCRSGQRSDTVSAFLRAIH